MEIAINSPKNQYSTASVNRGGISRHRRRDSEVQTLQAFTPLQ